MKAAHSRSGEFRKVGENLYRCSSSGIYYARFRQQGKEISRNLQTTDRELAKRRLQDQMDRLAKIDLKLSRVAPEKRALAASGLLEGFKKLWADSWGPRLEHILRNILLALMDQPEATLADVPRILGDQAFRRRAALNVTNRHVADFWLKEYEGYPAKFRAEAIAPIQNKVGAFLANPTLSRILTGNRNVGRNGNVASAEDVGRNASSFDLREVMDEGKILLVNLAKGKIGEDTASLLGALLVSRIGLTALSRADVHESERRDFYLYLDEFPTFTTLSLATMLSELRKYRLNLILAHQFLGQLDEQVRDAVFGNVGTIVSFRLGLADAEILEKEFYPEFAAVDLVNLPNYNILPQTHGGRERDQGVQWGEPGPRSISKPSTTSTLMPPQPEIECKADSSEQAERHNRRLWNHVKRKALQSRQLCTWDWHSSVGVAERPDREYA